MAETGLVRFQGSLDPTAQEYIPRNPTHAVILFRPPLPPPHVFFPYVAPAPLAEFHVMPFAAAAVEHFPAARVGVESTSATRAVALSGVPREASETSVRRELEAFGDVRAVQMERLRSDAVVTVHFYDLRSAESALAEIRARRHHYAAAAPFLPLQPSPPMGLLSGRGVWAQFVVPAGNAVTEGHNQGTIVIFNLDDRVTVSTLRDIFKPFGAIKELRETPAKRHQKFVEFFDVRDAAKALKEMNGKEIHGKPVVIEFSRPGGNCRKFMVNAALTGRNSSYSINTNTNAGTPPTTSSVPYNHTNNYPRPSSSSSHSKFFNPPPNLPPRKLHGRPATSPVSFGLGHAAQSQFPVRKSNCFVKNWSNNKNSTAATTSVERSKTTNSSSGAETTTTSSSTFVKKSASPPPTKSTVQCRSTRTKKSNKHGKKLDSRFLISEEAMTESSSCKDTRTTVMIKNIPNKYSQKLLFNMLDNHCIHCNKRIADGGDEDRDQPFSSYDFVYLPIDFNNKCNVGYGFVNMTSPEATWRLYKAFHLQLWEAFNSRKICEVTYARVQGLEALKDHFKNSKFPCEMDHYLPVVFSPPRDGRQLTEPLPIVGPPTIRHPSLTSSSSSSADGGDGSASHDVDGDDMVMRRNDGVAISDSNDDDGGEEDD